MAAPGEVYQVLAKGNDPNGIRVYWSAYIQRDAPVELRAGDPRVEQLVDVFENAVDIEIPQSGDDVDIVFLDARFFTRMVHLARVELLGRGGRGAPNHAPDLLDVIVGGLPHLSSLTVALRGYPIQINVAAKSTVLTEILFSVFPSTPTLGLATLLSLGPQLQKLKLIHSDNFHWPATWFHYLTKLEELELHRLMPFDATPIVLSAQTNLRVLCIDYCGLSEFPLNLHRLKHLRRVEIELNPHLTRVPFTIANLALLHRPRPFLMEGGSHLSLEDNQLQHIPEPLLAPMLLRNTDREFVNFVTAIGNPFQTFARKRGPEILSLIPPPSLVAIAYQKTLSQAHAEFGAFLKQTGTPADVQEYMRTSWLNERFMNILPLDLLEYIGAQWMCGYRCSMCAKPCLDTSWRVLFGRNMPFRPGALTNIADGEDEEAPVLYRPHVFEAYFDTPACLRGYFILGDTLQRYEQAHVREAGIAPAPAATRGDAKRARV